MAALDGGKLASHANFRPTDTVGPGLYQPAISPELWIVMTHVVGHGNAITHRAVRRGTLADTDVEATVAELDQFTDLAPTAPSKTDITPTLIGLSTPISMQSQYFPGVGGWTADMEVTMQQKEALLQYETEFGLDLIASFSNSTTVTTTLDRDGFIKVKVATMALNPEGTVYNAILHTSAFEDFIKDVGSLGNPLAMGAQQLLAMKPQGFQGNWEGVDIYATSQIDEHDTDEWQGAIVVGSAFNPVILSMDEYNSEGSMGSGLIMGPNRMTLKEFVGVELGSLISDGRLGKRQIMYRYRGHATVAHKQAMRFRMLKAA